MLIGQYETRISFKRRVAIPGKIRKLLSDKIIIARWYENCLVMVDSHGWEKLLSRLTTLSPIVTAGVRDTDRFILGSAFEVEPDGQGRVIVPAILQEYAGLTDNVVFVGLGDRVEIWDKEKWRAKEKEIYEYAPYLVEKIAKDNV